MAKIKNSQTGEIISVNNSVVRNGELWVFNKSPRLGERWFSKRPMLSQEGSVEGTAPNLALRMVVSEPWVLDTSKPERKPRTPKDTQAAPQKMTKVEIQDAAAPFIDDFNNGIDEAELVNRMLAMNTPQEVVDFVLSTIATIKGASEQEQEPQPQSAPEPTPEPDDAGEKLVAYIKALKGGTVDEAKVRKICEDVFAKYASEEPQKAKLVAKKASGSKGDEVYCEDFDDIVQDIADGFHVYLYGPAGSGKSHTAEQVAKALGLDFYGQTTIQFAHDVRGYGDASGKYQATAFYNAFKFGGLYFQDEYDRSNAEAAIVLNSALANGWYDFPIEGRVNAHPNFRFIAAGNTKMTGPDEEYVTGQEMDASSRDRFATMYKVDYLHKVEMHIANGDLEWVQFIEDLRHAIKAAGIQHIASYRATKYAAARKGCDKKKILSRSTLKGLESDEIRLIYGQLADTTSVWAKEMKKLF